MKNLSVFVLLALLVSCASAPPQNTANICSMFEERRSWYKAAVRSEERWGIPLSVSMAFIGQESSYQRRARPERTRLLGFIPWTRPSSAFGYAQVLDATWDEYQESAGGWGSSRTDFADAIDFVGWYNNNSVYRNRIQPYDAYNLYLAYHEGNGGFSRRTYSDKPWLLDVARRVQDDANRYAAQYAQCERELGRNWLMRLLF